MIKYDLDDLNTGECTITLKPGMAWAMCIARGPNGISGDGPRKGATLMLWPSLEEMEKNPPEFINQRRVWEPCVYGVIGGFCSGTGSIQFFGDKND